MTNVDIGEPKDSKLDELYSRYKDDLVIDVLQNSYSGLMGRVPDEKRLKNLGRLLYGLAVNMCLLRRERHLNMTFEDCSRTDPKKLKIYWSMIRSPIKINGGKSKSLNEWYLANKSKLVVDALQGAYDGLEVIISNGKGILDSIRDEVGYGISINMDILKQKGHLDKTFKDYLARDLEKTNLYLGMIRSADKLANESPEGRERRQSRQRVEERRPSRQRVRELQYA